MLNNKYDSNYSNEVEVINNDDNVQINIHKGRVPDIDSFKSRLPPKNKLTDDYIVNDYRDSPSPIKVMVRVFDGDFS